MSYKGRIYPREKCPLCGGTFEFTGQDFRCPAHLIAPNRFRIQVYSKDLHKAINICSDSRGIAFSSYEQADRILTQIRAEMDAGRFDVTRYVAQKLKPLKFSHWSNAWLEKKAVETEKGLRAPAYLKSLRVYVNKYQAFFGETDIRDIGTKKIHEFYLSLDGAPHYIKNVLKGLEKLLHDALDWGDIGIMPKFPQIDVPEPEIQTIDLDLQDSIISAIANPMDRAFILFTAREMIRPSETRALWWQDIDLKHDRVTIKRHFSLNQLRPATKAKQIKYLPLDGEVKACIEVLPRHISSPFLFWKGKQGRPFSEAWARKLWKRVASSFGVNVSLYQGTRHSSATEAADRAGLDAVQEFLHHSNRKMTQKYAKINPDRLRKVLRQT